MRINCTYNVQFLETQHGDGILNSETEGICRKEIDGAGQGRRARCMFRSLH